MKLCIELHDCADLHKRAMFAAPHPHEGGSKVTFLKNVLLGIKWNGYICMKNHAHIPQPPSRQEYVSITKNGLFPTDWMKCQDLHRSYHCKPSSLNGLGCSTPFKRYFLLGIAWNVQIFTKSHVSSHHPHDSWVRVKYPKNFLQEIAWNVQICTEVMLASHHPLGGMG